MLKRIAILVLFLGFGTALWFRQQMESAPILPASTALQSASTLEPQNTQSPLTAQSVDATTVSLRQQVDQLESPTIRVCLTNRTRKSFQLETPHPLTLQFGPLKKTKIAPTKTLKFSGKRTIQATSKGIQIGEEIFATEWIELIPPKSPSIWINDHQYRGNIRIHKRSNGKLLAINHLPLEEYLASVVDSEMPAAFPDEAREAQAIAARSYALYRMGDTLNHPTHNLFASTSSQKYLGFQYRTSSGRRLAGESSDSRQRVLKTAGTICLHDERLFCTYYSAVCGGQTTKGTNMFPDAAALIKSVPCDYCAEARLYRWQVTLSRKNTSNKISHFLSQRGKTLGPITSWKKLDDQFGPKTRYLIGDGRRIHQLTAQDLRAILPGLHSSNFGFTLQKNQVLIEGQGHGHGVGFCQWGSRGLALKGKSVEEILDHYYPGVKLHQVNSLEQYKSAMHGQRLSPLILRTADREHASR